MAALVTDLHAVNSALEVEGFGSGLLCSTVAFHADEDASRMDIVSGTRPPRPPPLAPVDNSDRGRLSVDN